MMIPERYAERRVSSVIGFVLRNRWNTAIRDANCPRQTDVIALRSPMKNAPAVFIDELADVLPFLHVAKNCQHSNVGELFDAEPVQMLS